LHLMQAKPFRNERVKRNLLRIIGPERRSIPCRLLLEEYAAHLSGPRNAFFNRAVSRLMRSMMRRAHTNSAASRPRPIRITGVPGPGVNIITIPRAKRVNPASIRKSRRTCSTVRRIINVQERSFLAERVGLYPTQFVVRDALGCVFSIPQPIASQGFILNPLKLS